MMRTAISPRLAISTFWKLPCAPDMVLARLTLAARALVLRRRCVNSSSKLPWKTLRVAALLLPDCPALRLRRAGAPQLPALGTSALACRQRQQAGSAACTRGQPANAGAHAHQARTWGMQALPAWRCSACCIVAGRAAGKR